MMKTAAEQLKWLADAPLFIDEAQINALHDATLRPDGEHDYVELEVTDDAVKKLGLTAGGELSAGLPKFLTTFIPGLSAEAKLSGSATGEFEHTRSTGKSVRLKSIHNAPRKLQELVLHYAVHLPNRLHFVAPTDLGKDFWRKPKEIVESPRILVFLDLPSLSDAANGCEPTTIVPTAAEFSNGTIGQIYTELGIDAAYPSQKPDQSYSDLLSQRQDYWTKFIEAFNDTKAMVAIENSAKEAGRIRWIDYRLRISMSGETLHLHICPSEKYDTGVFAYNFVKRGHKHGLRIVGTLKSEPDLNVLAVYEK